ncbi:MAG: hypothetical protein HQL07_01745 [Nitrospirae bacterium]|nr:hypothetical protein [Magnetococcales bacterium]HAT49404.1 hypothetical protein [Alphaproteobacteria bacterium]
MAQASKTYSESWHLVANLKVALRPTLKVSKQVFRGEPWYLLHDPFDNQFFRIRPQAYEFVARLSLQNSVEATWKFALRHNPREAPGQEEVISLLTALGTANLLHYDGPTASSGFFQRHERRRATELRSKVASFIFLRIPLFDPDAILTRIVPWFKPLFGPLGIILGLGLGISTLRIVFDHWRPLMDQSQGVLAPGNLVWLYLALGIIKIVHEFGHAIVCKHYGGEVRTMGVLMMAFTPLPYVDATASWSLSSRWQRIFVSSAGMLTELTLAGIGLHVWLNTPPGILHALAYNMVFVASVSTILFNLNPLMKMDGYYIFSDLIEIPNLSSRAQNYLYYLVERYFFGIGSLVSPATSHAEAWWLALYGMMSSVYRLMVMVGVMLFVTNQYLALGMLMGLGMMINTFIRPPMRLINYLTTNPKLERRRKRAIILTLLALGVPLAMAVFIPFPNHFQAPGIMEARHATEVVNPVSGILLNLETPSGRWVEEGTILVQLENPQLMAEILEAQGQLDQVQALNLKATHESSADLEPIQRREDSARQLLDNLEKRRQNLTIRATHVGLWHAPELAYSLGSWLNRGTGLGTMIDLSSFRFLAVVSQEEASNLFEDQVIGMSVRLYGQEGLEIEVTDHTFIPYQHESLPSLALGWKGGGEVAIATNDSTGLKTKEPFFLIDARLRVTNGVRGYHQRTGHIRITMEPMPLLWQIERKVRQFFQRSLRL